MFQAFVTSITTNNNGSAHEKVHFSLHSNHQPISCQHFSSNVASYVFMRKRLIRNRNVQKITKWFPTFFDFKNKQLVLGCSLKQKLKLFNKGFKMIQLYFSLIFVIFIFFHFRHHEVYTRVYRIALYLFFEKRFL